MTMSRATAFRLLLVATWLLPPGIALIDLALFMARPHATALVGGPPVTYARLMLEQLTTGLGLLALVAGIVATAGLWWFWRWAVYPFVTSVLAFAGFVLLCDYLGFRLLPQSALLVQGLGLGRVAAWLRHARHTLPFDAGR